METSKFVKQLASNNRVVREKALETLEQFIVSAQFKKSKQVQFDKLWKGLYYAMWFCDRPRPQQRLASTLGALHVRFFDERDGGAEELTVNDKAFVRFSKAFWRIMCLEWLGIDRFRLDKYLLLIRRALFNQFKYLQMRQWHAPLVAKYLERVLGAIPLSGDPKVYNGIPIHVMDIMLDEWERLALEDEEEELEEDKKLEIMKEFVSGSPLDQVLDILRNLLKNYDNSKILRDKVKKEVLTDKRLAQWGIVEKKQTEEEKEAQSEEEWKGF